MTRIRYHIAVIAAKLFVKVIQLLGRNGTHNPGVLAQKICPTILDIAPKANLVICVTGTNGKTSVNNMLCDALEKTGLKVASNRAGSNIVAGCTTALISGLDIFGRCKVDAMVFETDERASRLILPYLRPDYLVVTNLFRDSLKRNAHPDYIFSILDTYCPEKTKLILNADDLLSSRLRLSNNRVYFGIDSLPGDHKEPYNLIADHTFCPVCSSQMDYRYLRYHHIGNAVCPQCGYESPKADYLATNIDLENMRMTIAHDGVETEYPLVSNMLFNIYNQVTMTAMLQELGQTPEQLQQIFAQIKLPDIRYNRKSAGGTDVIRAVVKGQNSVSASRNFDFVSAAPGQLAVIIAVDDPSDHRRSVEYMGWIYDVEYERLNKENITQIVCAGPRCYDHRVRLLLAGVPEEKIVCTREYAQGAELENTQGLDAVYLLHDLTIYNLSCQMQQRICQRLEGTK